MSKQRHFLGATLCVILGGCVALPGLNLGPAGAPAPAGKQEPDAGPKALSGLTFQPLSDETAQKLGMFSSSNGPIANNGALLGDSSGMPSGTRAAEPAIAGDSSAAKAPTPQSGSTGGSALSAYSYQTYFPGPFGMMRLESVTEAVAPGATGTFRTLQDKVTGPVLAEWSADASLTETNASVDENGELVATQEAFPGQYGWRFTYAAASLREVLMFLVTPRETRVLRFRWVPVNIDPRSITVDTGEAIGKVVAAIRNPGIKSKEEELGRDYFFSPSDMKGSPGYGYGYGSGPMPMPISGPVAMPAEGKALLIRPPSPSMTPSPSFTLPPGMPTPPPFYWSEKVTEEPITELKHGGRWGVGLQPITKYVVWNLNYSYYEPRPTSLPVPMAMPYKPDAEPYRYEGPKEGNTRTWETYYVSAMVDARTGDLIRVSRPKRYTSVTVKVPIDYNQYGYGKPIGSPMPMPMATSMGIEGQKGN